jgi:hypothetical protein
MQIANKGSMQTKPEYVKPVLEQQPTYVMMTGKSIIFDALGFEDDSFDAEE